MSSELTREQVARAAYERLVTRPPNIGDICEPD